MNEFEFKIVFVHLGTNCLSFSIKINDIRVGYIASVQTSYAIIDTKVYT